VDFGLNKVKAVTIGGLVMGTLMTLIFIPVGFG